MAKKKKHDEEHIDETWLIPYADMLTLLLALFIVLFAASSVDANKFEELAKALNIAFIGGTGVLDQPSPVTTHDPSVIERPKEDDDSEEEEDPITTEEDIQELEELKKKIDQYISDNNLSLSLQTALTKEGLLITILDNALFSSGSAQVRPDAQDLAIAISNLLVTDPPRRISIGGHTDNIPINTPQFRSNWDLSVMRAVNFMKILLENDNLEPSRFSSTGYGEYSPVASNETEEGRAMNRRVEVLILPHN
jgi:chemotaxis protein MotB